MMRRRRRYGMVCVLSLLLLPATGLAAREKGRIPSLSEPADRGAESPFAGLDRLFAGWLDGLARLFLDETAGGIIPPPPGGENGGSCIDPDGCSTH